MKTRLQADLDDSSVPLPSSALALRPPSFVTTN